MTNFFSLDSPLRGAPPFRRAGTVTSVSFPSRGPLPSYGSLDASLCPRRHPRSHRSASSTARTGAPRPRSGSRTSPAAGTTSRPRSRATSASPSRTWACGAGRAATRPAARTRSRASGCASTAPSGSTRTTGRPKQQPRREDKYTNKSGGLAGRREGVAILFLLRFVGRLLAAACTSGGAGSRTRPAGRLIPRQPRLQNECFTSTMPKTQRPAAQFPLENTGRAAQTLRTAAARSTV